MSPVTLALLQGAVGFAIGAGTNDLAIRWIFHAVFTKKKREIGESVRSVISNELMTPDKIATRLASPESTAALQAAIEKHLDGICAKDLPSVDELAAATRDAATVQNAVDSVVNAVVDELSRRLSLPAAIRAFTDPFGLATGLLVAKVARKIPIGRLNRFARPELRSMLAKRMTAEYVAFIQAHTAELIHKTRIWDVVYDSVVRLDEKQMEKVTRQVANRELRGITWLGGVIGFGVGFSESLLIWAIENFRC
ncbi:MAG: DUF445 family protein [Kiritimatiellae bacterium]|nr:DUF445 family protein [Kiritimatiellia bacterium]